MPFDRQPRIYTCSEPEGAIGLLVWHKWKFKYELKFPIRAGEIVFAQNMRGQRIVMVVRPQNRKSGTHYIAIMDRRAEALVSCSDEFQAYPKESLLLDGISPRLIMRTGLGLTVCNLQTMSVATNLRICETTNGSTRLVSHFKYFARHREFHNHEIEREFERRSEDGSLWELSSLISPFGQLPSGKILLVEERRNYVDDEANPPRRKEVGRVATHFEFDVEDSLLQRVAPPRYLSSLRTPHEIENILGWRPSGKRYASAAKDAATTQFLLPDWSQASSLAAIEAVNEAVAANLNKLRLGNDLWLRFKCGQEVLNERMFCRRIMDSIDPNAARMDIGNQRAEASGLAATLGRLVGSYLQALPKGDSLWHEQDYGISAMEPFMGAMLFLDPTRLPTVKEFLPTLDWEHASFETLRIVARESWWAADTKEAVRAALFCEFAVQLRDIKRGTPKYIGRFLDVVPSEHFIALYLEEKDWYLRNFTRRDPLSNEELAAKSEELKELASLDSRLKESDIIIAMAKNAASQ